jgi:hypothetical protein
MTPQEAQRWYTVYRVMNGTKSFQDFQNNIIAQLTLRRKNKLFIDFTAGTTTTVPYPVYSYKGTDEQSRAKLVTRTMNNVYWHETLGDI